MIGHVTTTPSVLGGCHSPAGSNSAGIFFSQNSIRHYLPLIDSFLPSVFL